MKFVASNLNKICGQEGDFYRQRVQAFMNPWKNTPRLFAHILNDEKEAIEEPYLPASAVIPSVASDDNGDNGKLEVIYLDTNWLIQTAVIDMNGTTPVALPELVRINHAHYFEDPSNDSNQGNIAIADSSFSGGEPNDTTKVFVAIPPNQCLGQTTVFSTPANGYANFVDEGFVNSRDKKLWFWLVYRENKSDPTLATKTRVGQYFVEGLNSFIFPIEKAVPPKSDIWLEGWCDNGSRYFLVGYDIFIKLENVLNRNGFPDGPNAP